MNYDDPETRPLVLYYVAVGLFGLWLWLKITS